MITTARTVRDDIEMIRFYEKQIASGRYEKDQLAHPEEFLVELKRSVRKYLHRPPKTTRMVANYGDSCTTLDIWDDVDSYEAAVDKFMRTEYMEYRPSPYDCTGQLYTEWYKIFEKDGKFLVYHCFARDV